MFNIRTGGVRDCISTSFKTINYVHDPNTRANNHLSKGLCEAIYRTSSRVTYCCVMEDFNLM